MPSQEEYAQMIRMMADPNQNVTVNPNRTVSNMGPPPGGYKQTTPVQPNDMSEERWQQYLKSIAQKEQTVTLTPELDSIHQGPGGRDWGNIDPTTGKPKIEAQKQGILEYLAANQGKGVQGPMDPRRPHPTADGVNMRDPYINRWPSERQPGGTDQNPYAGTEGGVLRQPGGTTFNPYAGTQTGRKPPDIGGTVGTQTGRPPGMDPFTPNMQPYYPRGPVPRPTWMEEEQKPREGQYLDYARQQKGWNPEWDRHIPMLNAYLSGDVKDVNKTQHGPFIDGGGSGEVKAGAAPVLEGIPQAEWAQMGEFAKGLVPMSEEGWRNQTTVQPADRWDETWLQNLKPWGEYPPSSPPSSGQGVTPPWLQKYMDQKQGQVDQQSTLQNLANKNVQKRMILQRMMNRPRGMDSLMR